MELKPYQQEAIQFALARPNTLVADEMGLGKTISAIGVFNALPAAVPTMIVVCPANLVLNWVKETEKWLTKFAFVAPILAGMKPVHLAENIWVISYDLLRKWRKEIQNNTWDLIVYDESHYLKNPQALRTKEALQIMAKKTLRLTGTPILSRPLDLYTTLKACDPSAPSWWDYVHRYCGAHHKIIYTKKGQKKVLDCTGSSHLDELRERIQKFTIRRLKKDVLKELPPKLRQKLVLPASKFKKAIGEERTAVKTEVNVTKSRIEVARLKLPFVIEHVRNILEQENKVILFFYHHEIGDLLAEEFKDLNPALVHGNIPIAERKKNLERFQQDSSCRMLLGSIATAIGYDATAARVVVFCELDYVPGKLHQAEDRPHRIGQEDSVLIQYLVLEDSVDDDVVSALIEKTEVIDQVL